MRICAMSTATVFGSDALHARQLSAGANRRRGALTTQYTPYTINPIATTNTTHHAERGGRCFAERTVQAGRLVRVGLPRGADQEEADERHHRGRDRSSRHGPESRGGDGPTGRRHGRRAGRRTGAVAADEEVDADPDDHQADQRHQPLPARVGHQLAGARRRPLLPPSSHLTPVAHRGGRRRPPSRPAGGTPWRSPRSRGGSPMCAPRSWLATRS